MYGNNRICSVLDNILKKIEIDQKTIIHIEESYFGFTPKNISLINKIENRQLFKVTYS